MTLINYTWEKEKFYTKKDFLNDSDRLEIKKDIIKEIKNNDFDNKDSKYQTHPDLHERLKGSHWDNIKKKVNDIIISIGKYSLYRCWANYINVDSKYFLHSHNTALSVVYYIENPHYQYGTYIKKNNKEIIILGYENSIQIFNSNLLHELVFPPKEILKNQPRISLAFDYEKTKS
tara:strand:- start:330 stop:854 length:525 start_codon:yes stop_codon:yes gene_type:complete